MKRDKYADTCSLKKDGKLLIELCQTNRCHFKLKIPQNICMIANTREPVAEQNECTISQWDDHTGTAKVVGIRPGRQKVINFGGRKRLFEV